MNTGMTLSAAQTGLITGINASCAMIQQNPGTYGVDMKNEQIRQGLVLLRRIGFGEGAEAASIRDSAHPLVRQWVEKNGINPAILRPSPKLVRQDRGVRFAEMDLAIWKRVPQPEGGEEFSDPEIYQPYNLKVSSELNEKERAAFGGQDGVAFEMQPSDSLSLRFDETGKDSLPYAVRVAIGERDAVTGGGWGPEFAPGNYAVVPSPVFRLPIPPGLHADVMKYGLNVLVYRPKEDKIFELSADLISGCIYVLNEPIEMKTPPFCSVIRGRLAPRPYPSQLPDLTRDPHGFDFWETAHEMSGRLYVRPMTG